MRVTWLDREAARVRAREAAAKLAAEHPEVSGVLLFGSILRGDAVPGSDVDLLVVLSESEKAFLDRLPDYAPAIEGMGVDVFPYTEAELATMIEAGNSLIDEALREGEWVVGGLPPRSDRHNESATDVAAPGSGPPAAFQDDLTMTGAIGIR